MKFVTFNLNSIRSRPEALDYLIKEENPDVIFLQELKCEESVFPYSFFTDTDYKYFAINGQKRYNGVALISKYPLCNIQKDFLNNPVSEEARFVSAEVFYNDRYLTLISLYIVNGSEINHDKYHIKLKFINELTKYISSINDRPIVIGTDFNISLKEIDAAKFIEDIPTSVQERESMQAFLDQTRLYDVFRIHHPNTREYTWWSYRAGAFQRDVGFRIDYFFSNLSFSSIKINKEFRGMRRASDHTYIVGSLLN